MQSAWFDSTVAWIGAHPQAAGALIFLVAFCDALIVVGAVVPALPLLFAIGVLIGLGEVSGPYAMACAATGALLGDGLSYWIGRRWGAGLRTTWPFAKYPQLLERGEALFRRNAVKSILIARYVGPVRPFVPAIAGISRMPLRRYLPISLFAAISWAGIFLAPGWIFGASYDAVAAVADKLALVLLGLFAMLALVWAVVLYTWRWFAVHADSLLARALAWTRAHPRLGRYVAALVDPRRPESASLVLLAACLFVIAWLWAGFSATLLMRGGPSLLDHDVHAAMFALRNPLADRLMASLAGIGSLQVLAPPVLVATAWLVWRKRWMAAAHWLAAIAVGLLLTTGLEAAVDMPRPPDSAAGFGFPSVAVTMTTVVFGFFAVLIGREFPGRQRMWPYLLAGVATVLVGFARLYLGAHWLSDLTAGVLLGVAWLLVLGIAYRRHSARSFYMRPLGWAFYGSLLLAAGWHVPRSADATLARFAPAPAQRVVADAEWRARGLQDAHPHDLQLAGDAAALQRRLLAQGWTAQPPADWVAVLGLLDDDHAPHAQPVLPASHAGHPEHALLRRPVPGSALIDVLRIWPASARLADGRPLWVLRHERMQWQTGLPLLQFWQPLPAPVPMPEDLRALLAQPGDGSAVRGLDEAR